MKPIASLKSPTILLSLIFLLLISATSCSLHIEKRRYRQGYHVEVSYSNKLKQENPNRIQESNIETVNNQPDLPAINKSPEVKDSLIQIATKPVINKKKVVVHHKKKPTILSIKKRGDRCDIITFTDGTQAEILVEEISETEIKYKKCNYKDGPSYRISKWKVKQIAMYNGELYIPQPTKKSSNGAINGQIITSLVLGIIALILTIIGGVLIGSGGSLATAVLAPAGILSLVGLIIGATTLKRGAHWLAWFAFILNVIVQALAIVFTILMF